VLFGVHIRRCLHSAGKALLWQNNIVANTIDGGGGVDRLTGDAGNDTFVFHAGQANGDTVVEGAGSSEKTR
jgi:Ca2+-binding RTX toxin-like protein